LILRGEKKGAPFPLMVGAFAKTIMVFTHLDYCRLILMLAFAVPTLYEPIISDSYILLWRIDGRVRVCLEGRGASEAGSCRINNQLGICRTWGIVTREWYGENRLTEI
jgi:hypothetical protein